MSTIHHIFIAAIFSSLASFSGATEELPSAQYITTIDRAHLTASTFGQMAGLPDYIRLKHPVAVGVRDNIVFIFDAFTGSFYRYDTQLETIVTLSSVTADIQQNISSITVLTDYSFFATDPYGRKVLHIASDGTVLNTISNDANMSHPVATGYDIFNSRLLVADSTFDHIIAFDKTGRPVFAFGERGTGHDQIRLIVDMATHATGIYVLDQLNNQVKKFSYSGEFMSSFPRNEVDNPTAIAVDRDERVYISDGFDDTIKVYYQGKLIDTLGGTGVTFGRFNMVTDLVIAQNFLYVVDSLNARIQVFIMNPLPQVEMSKEPRNDS